MAKNKVDTSKGECFQRGDKYGPGHSCKQGTFKLLEITDGGKEHATVNPQNFSEELDALFGQSTATTMKLKGVLGTSGRLRWSRCGTWYPMVKAVYVKNLPKNVTQEQLERMFEHHGKITKVVLPPAKAGHEKSRFGFVHFADRSSVLKALKNTEKYELNGQTLECSLAKPQADQKSSGGSSNSQKAAILPSHPRVGYNLVGGALGAGYGTAGYPQPLVYGRGPSTAGMAMMPMLLPDGRIGYVLHTPPPPPQKQRGGGGRGGGSGSSGGGSGSSGGRRRGGNDSGGRGRSRYNPY